MGQAAYPAGSDVEEALEAAGVTITDQLSLVIVTSTAAAIADFEEAVGRRMLAPTAAETFYYDPPTNSERLVFLDDFATVTGVVVQPQGGTAETLVANEDYWLEPYNAPAKGKPYERLRARRRWTEPLPSSLRRALRVTGRQGYATELPDDAWQAMVDWACASVIVSVGASASGGVRRKKIEDYEVDYGEGPYRAQLLQWTGRAARVTDRYARLEL